MDAGYKEMLWCFGKQIRGELPGEGIICGPAEEVLGWGADGTQGKTLRFIWGKETNECI